MSEQNDLLLGFVRTTARHSGLRGDTLGLSDIPQIRTASPDTVIVAGGHRG